MWLGLGNSRAGSITRQQDRTDQTKFTVLAPLTCNFGPFGSDFWAQVAPTWAPGLAKVRLPLQRGIEFDKLPFSLTYHKKLCLQAPAWRPNRPQIGSDPPGAVNQSPKCPKQSICANQFLCLFLNFLGDLSPQAFKVASGVQL